MSFISFSLSCFSGDADYHMILPTDNQLIGGMYTSGLYYAEADLSEFLSGYSDLEGLGASGVKTMLQRA